MGTFLKLIFRLADRVVSFTVASSYMGDIILCSHWLPSLTTLPCPPPLQLPLPLPQLALLLLSNHVNSITFYFPPLLNPLLGSDPGLCPIAYEHTPPTHTHTCNLVLHMRQTVNVCLPEPGVFTHFPANVVILF